MIDTHYGLLGNKPVWGISDDAKTWIVRLRAHSWCTLPDPANYGEGDSRNPPRLPVNADQTAVFGTESTTVRPAFEVSSDHAYCGLCRWTFDRSSHEAIEAQSAKQLSRRPDREAQRMDREWMAKHK